MSKNILFDIKSYAIVLMDEARRKLGFAQGYARASKIVESLLDKQNIEELFDTLESESVWKLNAKSKLIEASANAQEYWIGYWLGYLECLSDATLEQKHLMR